MLQLFGATAFGFILSSAGPHIRLSTEALQFSCTQVTSLLESANPRANETNKRLNEIKARIETLELGYRISIRWLCWQTEGVVHWSTNASPFEARLGFNSVDELFFPETVA